MDKSLKEHSALLIIDVQQDFCGPTGLMAHYNADLSMIDGAVDRIELLTDHAHAQRIPVIYVSLVTRPQTDSRAMKAWYARQGMDGEQAVALCRDGSPGAEWYRVKPAAEDYIVEKQRYSAFVATNLELLLQQLQIKRLIVTGVTTECCVDSTVRDGFMKDYEMFVVEDACAAYELEMHAMSIKIIGLNFATIMSTEQVLTSWNGVE
ncbi:cysteine hydrolase family protein [Paenibacillus septentrionalis]|uniref:Cysteine hydrolase family protein n=1 Tax=Paenibacillus septentrionalis TaxID=429342 RepID=A0ABW1V319_9BACL